jgi:hypothetical protein
MTENADTKATEKKSAFDTNIKELQAQEDSLIKDGNENLKKLEEAKKQSIQDWEVFFYDMVEDEGYGYLSKDEANQVGALVEKAIQAIENQKIEEVKEASKEITDIYDKAARETNKEKTNVAGQANNKSSTPEQQAASIRSVIDLVTKATTSVVGLTSAFNGL